MTFGDNPHMGSSASVHSSSAAAPAHLNFATDPLNLLQNPQMGVGYLPDQMQSHNFSQSFQSASGRSTPSAYNPQSSHSTQPTQQQQFGDTWNDDIAFLTALTAANNPPSAQHTRRHSTADIDAIFLAPDAALPQASFVDAPHPDQFESELENFLASADPVERSALDAYNPVVDYTSQAFTNYRLPGTYSVGAHSIITASSESGYDDGRSESYYNPYSPQGSLVNAANPTSLTSLHFGINPEDFQALNFDDPALGFDTALSLLTPISQAPPVGQNLNLNPPGSSAINLDLLTMPSSMTSQQTHSSYDKGQDSDGSQRSDGSAERERKFGTIPGIPGQPYTLAQPQSLTDARKKYQCPSCPRAFARAFNLKTHMATHDPNRLKPYVCTHKTCNRSFSRKHDLGRHLVSIHKDEAGLTMSGGGGSAARSTVGVPGHPLPNNHHSSTGRVHRVGGNDTPKHQGVQPPTLPNIPLKRNDGLSSLANAAYPLHPSLTKTNSVPLKGA